MISTLKGQMKKMTDPVAVRTVKARRIGDLGDAGANVKKGQGTGIIWGMLITGTDERTGKDQVVRVDVPSKEKYGVLLRAVKAAGIKYETALPF
jgi:hypothetical protein